MKLLISYLVFFIIPLACNNKQEETAEEAAVAVDNVSSFQEADDKSKEVTSLNIPEKPSELIDQKIIKESNLRFETQNLEDTHQLILKAIKKNNAYIQNDAEGKDYNSLYRNITIRIPNENFDFFLAEISKGVAYFDKKEVTARDVTEEYIDLSARLKTKKTLEERYLQLLNKATKVSEILEIEKELSAIREEIESKEGQLKYLQNKVSLSTINIEFYKTVANAEDATMSYGTKMWNAIQSGWNGISSFFIGLLHVWPFILILVAVFIFARKRWLRKTTKL
jgi:Domain of unknown function (DUF4349)